MAKADISEKVAVDPKKFFETVTQYENYPQFVEGCRKVKVERKGPGKARVAYEVNVMGKDVQYTLDHDENPETGDISWSLVESNMFKKNSGRWTLRPAGPGQTDAKYELEIEFKMWVPGPVLSTLVKGSLPTMFKSFAERAKKG